jgi:hypothetical protein
MSVFERLLEPGNTELPSCLCGSDMHDAALERPAVDTHIRVYRCDACGHELRLTVWASESKS